MKPVYESPFSLEEGRQIFFQDEPFACLVRENDQISPAVVDDVARRIVDALNRDARAQAAVGQQFRAAAARREE